MSSLEDEREGKVFVYGDPRYIDDEGEDEPLCECNHATIFHVNVAANRLEACKFRGCSCQMWRRQRDEV